MKSVVILGKGTSVKNCTESFVSSHDTICTINDVVFTEEYKPYIGFKTDIQFCNSSVDYYPKEIYDKLGLKRLIFHGRKSQQFKPTPDYYQVEKVYVKPNLHTLFTTEYGFDPSGGVQAFYYFIKIEKYDIISIVGFDFYQVGSTPYYYKLEEGSNQLRNQIIKQDYVGYKINVPSGHDSDKSIKFCHQLIDNHPDITFNIISNNDQFTSLQRSNIKYIK
jgi:hypothetical protein